MNDDTNYRWLEWIGEVVVYFAVDIFQLVLSSLLEIFMGL